MPWYIGIKTRKMLKAVKDTVINLPILVSAGSSHKHAIANQGCSVIHKGWIELQAVLFKHSDFPLPSFLLCKESRSILKKKWNNVWQVFYYNFVFNHMWNDISSPAALKNTPVDTAKHRLNFWNQSLSIWWVDRGKKNSGKTLWRLRFAAPNWTQFSQFVLVEVLIITKMAAVKQNVHVLKSLIVGSCVKLLDTACGRK